MTIFSCLTLYSTISVHGIASFVLGHFNLEEGRLVRTVVCMHLISKQLLHNGRKTAASIGLGFVNNFCPGCSEQSTRVFVCDPACSQLAQSVMTGIQ